MNPVAQVHLHSPGAKRLLRSLLVKLHLLQPGLALFSRTDTAEHSLAHVVISMLIIKSQGLVRANPSLDYRLPGRYVWEKGSDLKSNQGGQ